MAVIFIFTIFTTICCAATPPIDFVSTEVHAIIPGNGLPSGGSVTLKEFVEAGLKKGTWKNQDKNQWVYYVDSYDSVARKQSQVSFSFVKAKLEFYAGKEVIILNRIVANKVEYNTAMIYKLYDQIYSSLPSVRKAVADSEQKYKDKVRSEKQEAENKLINSIWAKYGSNMGFGETEPSKILVLSKLTDKTMQFNIKTTVYNSDTSQNETGCQISGQASYSIDKDEFYTNFKSIYEEPDCNIKFDSQATGDSFVAVDVKYKGSCKKYCGDIDKKARENNGSPVMLYELSDLYSRYTENNVPSKDEGWK